MEDYKEEQPPTPRVWEYVVSAGLLFLIAVVAASDTGSWLIR